MQGLERCVVVEETENEALRNKELVNLEMVRIKKVGKHHVGLEVFMQDGLYGVMRNGRISCPAKFKRIERLDDACGFFALAVYRTRNERMSHSVVDVTTVIDKKGQDLNVKLYGRVLWTDKGYFCGIVDHLGYSIMNCWDPVGNSYYDCYPDFRNVGGVEIGLVMDHRGDSGLHCWKLRYSTGIVSPRFGEREMFCNKHIVIARDYLIVKGDHNHSYSICGYMDDSILVRSDEQYGYQQIFLNGKKGRLFKSIPQGITRVLNAKQLGLKRPT